MSHEVCALRAHCPMEPLFDERRRLQALAFRFQFDADAYSLAQDSSATWP